MLCLYIYFIRLLLIAYYCLYCKNLLLYNNNAPRLLMLLIQLELLLATCIGSRYNIRTTSSLMSANRIERHGHINGIPKIKNLLYASNMGIAHTHNIIKNYA